MRTAFSDKDPPRRRLRAPLAASAVLLLLVPAVALPAAASANALPPMGTTAGDISTLRAAGASPGYASYWAGDWMATSGWAGFDRAMQTAKAAKVTPVVYWYYWGDSISPACVEDGCNGRDRAEWLRLTDELASHLRSTLGGAEVIVVLENEFNKGGITGTYAPTFDARLEGVAKTLKAVPGVKIVVGFGGWSEASWSKFPKTIAQSDYIGFQVMRASTKDTEASYRGAADRSAELATYIEQKFGKPSFLYDLALSSYPDARWETIQAETLDAVFQKLARERGSGLQGIVYRSLNDHYMSPSNYYGHAESHWGLRTKDGKAKPAFDVWKKHANASTAAVVQVAAPAPAAVAPPPAPAAPAFSATFSNVKGNSYWVQTDVSANRPIASVCASVDGGACKPLTRHSYGYSASFHVPTGARVVLKATSTDGATATSAAYTWPTATLADTAQPAAAKFVPYDGNAHWVQTKVVSDKQVKSLCASLNGGTCKPLTHRSWGAWGASIPAPSGTKVVFKATLADGSKVTSSTYTWPVK